MTPPDDKPDRNPIEVITDDFVERLRQGQQPTIEEYAALHPEIADEILELLPTVLAMEELKLQKEQSDRSRFLRGPGSLTRLGDFLILAEIGRGGMGIVYEAEQQSLGRHVAVKVLPRQSLLDEHRLERFQREAQTAARLHHTNIVPIFGVGEQDGYHYYVMQFIRGLGIDRVVRELRGEPPTVRPDISGNCASMSGLARQAASALCNGRFPEPNASSSESSIQSDSQLQKAADSGGNASEPTTTESPATPSVPAAPRAADFWRSVARVGMQVADALSYAHSQGTLHRDIKPANLLLDGNGVVWITDFGLAKAVEDSNITHTGDVVGTLQYMAPEQFCGEYDTRSDIYCLGLTLYELLTLQPAHRGSNRSGLIQKVTQGTPAAPRKIDPSIPADLETVILKAISREPSHRYQTSADLRDDLQRFLDDRPIMARRTNPAQLVWRWCHRNKSLASAIGVAILATLALTFVGWVSYAREAERRTGTLAVNQRITENLELQRQVFEKIFYRLVGPDVFQSMIRVESAATSEDSTETADALTDYQSISIPVVSQKDARLLQDVLEFYDLFAAQNEDRPELQFNSAVAYHHVGDIHLRLGQLDEARDAYIRAIQQYKRQPTDHEKEIASIRNQLGQVYANQRMLTAARDSYSLVIGALEKAEGTPRFEDQRWRYELARAHDFMGSLGTRQREEGREAARRGPRRGPEGRRGPEVRRRPSGSRRRDNARRIAERMHGPSSEERRNHHATAQRLLAKLIEESPNKSEYKLAKARSCRNFAGYLSRSRNEESKDQAPVLVKEAIEILEALVDESTQLPHFRFELAETLISIRPSRSDPTESQERVDHRAGRLWSNRVERAEKILRTLRDKYPTVPSYTEGLARALHERHHILMRKRERVLGIATLRESIGLLEGLRERWPANAEYLRTIADRRMAYAGLLEREADPSGLGLNPALEQIQKSVTEFEAFRSAKVAPPPGSERGLVNRYRLMARILDRLGRVDEAEAARTKYRQLQEGSGR